MNVIDPTFGAGPVSMKPIGEISIGHRHRQDYGDIDALAASIEAIGLLHPIVVSQHGRLLAGQRRLMAFKLLGRETIPVTAIEVQDD